MEQLELFSAPENPDGGVELGVEASSEIDDAGSVALTDELSRREISWRLALEKYDVVKADPEAGYMIMAERKANKAFADTVSSSDVSIAELGSSAPSPWTSWTREEHIPELRDRQGLTKYYRMKRNDGIVRGSLRALKTSLLAAHWYVKPGSSKKADVKIAKFVQKNLFCDLNTSFQTLLNDILLSAEYGYMPFEKVYWPPKAEGGRFVQKLRKIAPRHPMDVREWEYDANGGPDAIVMENSRDNPMQPGVRIPISKLVIYTPESEAGDLSGISVLRSAYKHWYYKDTLYKIDAIQKERHGIGIPIIKLPMGFGPDDKALAEDLGRNLRTNERAHIVLPPGWEVLFAKVEGQMVDCMKSIEHHDMAIMANVLGAWLKDPKTQSDTLDMFLKSTRYIATVIADITTRYVIRELVDLNFKLGPEREYPELVCRRIGEWQDLRTQSFTVRNLVGAGVIEPDDVLEDTFREELDMPLKDKATARKMITDPASMQPEEDETDEAPPTAKKQQGMRAGAPRQQPTPPSGSGRSNAGVDRRGS